MIGKFRLQTNMYILAVAALFLLSMHAIACDSCNSMDGGDAKGTFCSDEQTVSDNAHSLDQSCYFLDEPEKPIKPQGPNEGEVNKLLPFKTMASNSNGGYIRYVFEWWENGMLSDKESTGYVPPDTWATKYHAWHSCGDNNYVRVKAVDRNGGESEWSDRKYVYIFSIPQIPTVYAPCCACIGKAVRISAQTIDNCNSVRYQYDWGDGRTVTTSLFKSGNLDSQWVSWNKAKTYTIRVRAQNSQGKWSDWTSKRVVVKYCMKQLGF